MEILRKEVGREEKIEKKPDTKLCLSGWKASVKVSILGVSFPSLFPLKHPKLRLCIYLIQEGGTPVEVTRYIKDIECYQRPLFACETTKPCFDFFSHCSQLVLYWEVLLGDGPSTNMAVRGPSCYVQYSLSLDGF